jgi:hypothetical protein
MNLNQIILKVLEEYSDKQVNMMSESFRKMLAKQIESEVDKYCKNLMEAIATGSCGNCYEE